MAEVLLKVEHLKKYYPIRKRKLGETRKYVKAVDDISFELKRGETLGIVGESGCGKSSTIKTIMRMVEPTEGEIWLNGQNFRQLKGTALKKARQSVKLIFQDPYSSLNPRMTVRDIIAEPLDITKAYKTKEQREQMVEEAMKLVELNLDFLDRYPHEFSGGQRQRIGIARAIILKPQIVICDEPVSALDVSIQAKIINLLKDLQKQLGISYIFISHDLSVVKHIADRIAVMYLGQIVEQGSCHEIFENPKNPYTQVLLESVPRIGQKKVMESTITGDMPSPADPPRGCCFHTRCPYAMTICEKERPELEKVQTVLKEGTEHSCACHLGNKQ